MSGHSKWSTIKRQKGAADIRRGLTFTKLANAIAIAARLGGSDDPNSNPRLRTALESARKVNMPKENVQRAIDRGLGRLPGQTLEEVVYEGFGPAKVAFIVEGVTDNKLRTLQEIKNIFDRSGGSLGSSGSASYLFDKKGEIKVRSKGGDLESEMLELIDLGAEDVEDYQEDQDSSNDKQVQKYLIYCDPALLNELSNAITQSGFTIEESEVVMRPNLTVQVPTEQIESVLTLADKLEELDDVQKVYTNLDSPESSIT